MRVELFDFELPESSIAQRPSARRDEARLLVVDPETSELRDARVFDLPELVAPGALVVVNDTKVLRARLFGKKPTGGKVELLLVERRGEGPSASAPSSNVERWRALGRGLGELAGKRLSFGDEGVRGLTLSATVEGASSSPGLFDVCLEVAAGTVAEAVDALGQMPIPPYLRRPADAGDGERYQTVFARVPGAVAAPTAGLHLTERLLDDFGRRGVRVGRVTLHVGPATFQPVAVDDLDQHPMHAEWLQVGDEVAAEIVAARERKAPVVAVGTTVVRALETAADPERRGLVKATEGETRLLIQPGYDFRVVDALLTNFHLPRSTLIALVAAFAGRTRLLDAYAHAIRRGYRFYSYGDAMWLPGKVVGA